jgi:hypothetical protein
MRRIDKSTERNQTKIQRVDLGKINLKNNLIHDALKVIRI